MIQQKHFQFSINLKFYFFNQQFLSEYSCIWSFYTQKNYPYAFPLTFFNYYCTFAVVIHSLAKGLEDDFLYGNTVTAKHLQLFYCFMSALGMLPFDLKSMENRSHE